jgi:hypothetical protein
MIDAKTRTINDMRLFADQNDWTHGEKEAAVVGILRGFDAALEHAEKVFDDFGRCINCRCYFGSPMSKRLCAVMGGKHKWYLPYEDLKRLGRGKE